MVVFQFPNTRKSIIILDTHSSWMLKERFKIILGYVQEFGLGSGLRELLYFRLKASNRVPVQVSLPSCQVPIFVRPRTSDVSVFEQIFINKDYDLSFLNLKPRFIIDAGANIELSSVFFAQCYPEAHVVAVEPEQSNFEMLVQNVRSYTNISPIRAAMWCKRAWVKIQNTKVDKWAFRVVETESTDPLRIQGMTVLDLATIFRARSVDILKLDIEGAEKELFQLGYEGWLGKTEVIVAELHDQIRPGCTELISRVTKQRGFVKIERKDHSIFVKKNI